MMYTRTFWDDAEQWAKEHGGLGMLHPIFSLTACSIFNVRPDPMHIIDLGIAHYLRGSVFFIFCYHSDHFPGPRSIDARCDALWQRAVNNDF